MAVDVGSAVGYLDLDTSGFLTGLKTAQSEANKSANKLESIGNKFTSVGDKIAGVGTKLTTAITVPLAGAVTAVVKSYADMEQAIGGIETLFKGNAASVIANAETAYKRAGISAVDYMEQITSFSASLLQSVGGDTKEAARVADMAMVDMSDNANKFGTNIGSIQDAYQGFAKQNYTMLDNLKLGYGGTRTEMERLLADAEKLTGKKYDISNLNDVYEAIHVIQEEMGVAGTTALEANETISGSFGMAKAAVSDFLANLGKPGADMEKFKNNMVEAIKIFVGNIKEVLATIWENIPLKGWQKNLIVAAAAAGPFLLVVGKLVSGIGTLITTIGKIPYIISGAKTAFIAIKVAIAGVSAPVVAVIAVIGLLVAAFINLWKTNEGFRNKMIAIWNQIKETVSGFVQGIVDRVNALGFDFKNITDILWSIWKGFCDLLAPVFEGVFQQIANILSAVTGVITGILDVFIGIFTGNWSQAWNGIKTIFSSIWNAIKSIVTSALNIIKSVVVSVFDRIKSIATSVWNAIKTAITVPIEAAKNTISRIINKIKSVFTSGFNAVKFTVTSIFDSIKSKITSVMDSAKNTVSRAINKIKSFFNFSWSLPKLKLPHVKISGKFSLKPPSVPKFSVEWYKKAMGGGMILDSPTIFGFNPKTGKFLAGGEAGSETVVGTNSLMNMIKAAVQESNAKIIQTITKYFNVVLDNIKSSNEKLLYSVGYLVTASYQFAQACEDLSYVAYNGFVKSEQAIVESNKNRPVDKSGDTFIFNSPKPIDEIEAARQMKKTKRDLSEGF